MKIIISIFFFAAVLIPLTSLGQELDQQFLIAVKNGKVTMINALLDQEQELAFVRYKDGRTPLMLASAGGHTQAVIILLNFSDVNEKDKDGWTALKLAAASGHAETIQVLLDSDSCVDCIPDSWLFRDKKEMDDWTALLLAAKGGHTKAVEILLAAGADVNYLAERMRKIDLEKQPSEMIKEVQEFQLNAKIKINPDMDRGTTALILAVGGDHVETVKVLLDHGALINIKNSQLRTAPDIATEKGFNRIIPLLQGDNVASAEDYNKQGLLSMKARNYSEAIIKFTEALKMKQSYASAFYNRGTAKLVGSEDYVGAISDFTKAIEIEPMFGKVYIARGLAKLRYGKRESGCSDLREAEQLGLKVQHNIIEENCSD